MKTVYMVLTVKNDGSGEPHLPDFHYTGESFQAAIRAWEEQLSKLDDSEGAEYEEAIPLSKPDAEPYQWYRLGYASNWPHHGTDTVKLQLLGMMVP